MSDFVLGEQIEKHTDALEAIGKALIDGDNEAVITTAASLVTTIASGQPWLGSFVAAGLGRVFAQSANAVLRQQIADWSQELDRKQLIAQLADAVEILLGQALIQVIRVQHNVKDEIIEALGGKRGDLAWFRQDFATRAAAAGAELQHIEQELISGGATGVRVRAESRRSVFISQGTVTGAGTVGVEIG